VLVLGVPQGVVAVIRVALLVHVCQMDHRVQMDYGIHQMDHGDDRRVAVMEVEATTKVE
jgi:hypothetical protein